HNALTPFSLTLIDIRCGGAIAPDTYHLLFFFNDTATPEIYTLSLHDALPICETTAGGLRRIDWVLQRPIAVLVLALGANDGLRGDRKSTRLNSSHVAISYAVFCLKKKKHNYKASGQRDSVKSMYGEANTTTGM